MHNWAAHADTQHQEPASPQMLWGNWGQTPRQTRALINNSGGVQFFSQYTT